MIQAKVVADSIEPKGDRLTTLEVVFPRYILAEFNTHRMLSKNSASSRAIPFNKMIQSVQDNPFIPYAWQKDHKGMQGSEYLTEEETYHARTNWLLARDSAIKHATNLNRIDVTKQLANRLLEPFMYHKVLVSGTEWENFFNLRCPQYSLINEEGEEVSTYAESRKEWRNLMNKKDKIIHYEDDYSIIDWLKINKGQADIHMMFLAEAIYDAINESTPNELEEGQWHIPYGDNMAIGNIVRLAINKGLVEQKENLSNYNDADYEIFDGICRKISISRCARLSYQTLGDKPVIDYEVDLKLYEILAKSGHWSPFEHIARVMSTEECFSYTKGNTDYLNWKPVKYSIDLKENNYKEYLFARWCRNFKGFIQYRELLDN